jgi:hypothetical protein
MSHTPHKKAQAELSKKNISHWIFADNKF